MKKVLIVLYWFGLLLFGGLALILPRMAQNATHATTQPTNYPTRQFTPAPTRTPETSCIVSVDALNVRSCAGVGCAVVGSVKRSETVNIAEKSGGWVRISAKSWVNVAYLTCGGAK